jgi:hypothetical protein
MKRLVVALVVAVAAPLFAQEPKKDAKKSDEASFRVGGMIFADFTYTAAPTSIDAEGNAYHPSSFGITRAHINFLGTFNRYLSFRVTPDIARESGSGSSLSGSQNYRLKFAYAQWSLANGSWIRAGLINTPWIEYEESIYRYRFQGPTLPDREGLMAVADNGVGVRYNFRGDYGDVNGGIYNGETYTRQEPNDQKSLQVRLTARPLPKHALLKGWRVTGFVNEDRYAASRPRRRMIIGTTFEHPRVLAGFDLVRADDQPSADAEVMHARGYSAWLNPRLGKGWELLLRRDRYRPDRGDPLTRRRDVAGVAYWLPTGSGTAAALLLDRDSLRTTGVPTLTNYGVKMLISF